MEEEWNAIRIDGRKTFIMKEKLKQLKYKLKWWNKEVFRWIDLKVEEDVKDLIVLDELAGSFRDNVDPDLVGRSNTTSQNILKNLQLKENLIKQKSRVA